MVSLTLHAEGDPVPLIPDGKAALANHCRHNETQWLTDKKDPYGILAVVGSHILGFFQTSAIWGLYVAISLAMTAEMKLWTPTQCCLSSASSVSAPD